MPCPGGIKVISDKPLFSATGRAVALGTEQPQMIRPCPPPHPSQGLLKPQDPGPPLRGSESAGLKWSLRMGISDRRPGPADAGLGATP